MKTETSSVLSTHIAGTVTTLATLCRIKRYDAQEFYFTNHDQDISFEQRTYEADEGISRTAIQNDSTLAVDNLDVKGFLTPDKIVEAELRNGVFDYAEVWLALINWANPSQGIIKMRRGRLGEVKLTPQGVFMAELRGMVQPLAMNIGSVYQTECRTDLGSSECGVQGGLRPPERQFGHPYEVGDFIRVQTNPAPSGVGDVLILPFDEDTISIGTLGAEGTLGSEASISAVQAKFGVGSLRLVPTVDINSPAYCRYANHPTMTIGSNPFTIEGWIFIEDYTDTQQVIASEWRTNLSKKSWQLICVGNNLYFYWSDDGSTTRGPITNPFTWAEDTWYHVAVCRDGSNNLRMFVDGNQIGTTQSLTDSLYDADDFLYIGKVDYLSTDEDPFHGFIDDFRFAPDTAYYTTDFTPPTEPHSIAPVFQEVHENRVYECTTAGTSANTQPTYDTTIGNTTTDGTAVFTCRNAFVRHATINAVTSRQAFTITVSEARAVDDWFNGGAIHFENGDNVGVSEEIRDWVNATSGVTLFIPLHYLPANGDKVYLFPGCDKRTVTCRTRFDNILNYRGEPFIPGNDAIIRMPDAR